MLVLLPWRNEIHFAPPKKPWNDDSPVLPTKNGLPWFQSGAGFCPSTVCLMRRDSQVQEKSFILPAGSFRSELQGVVPAIFGNHPKSFRLASPLNPFLLGSLTTKNGFNQPQSGFSAFFQIGDCHWDELKQETLQALSLWTSRRPSGQSRRTRLRTRLGFLAAVQHKRRWLWRCIFEVFSLAFQCESTSQGPTSLTHGFTSFPGPLGRASAEVIGA